MEGVVFVAGIYDVGKSTLRSNLTKKLNIDFNSAGDLISEYTVSAQCKFHPNCE